MIRAEGFGLGAFEVVGRMCTVRCGGLGSFGPKNLAHYLGLVSVVDFGLGDETRGATVCTLMQRQLLLEALVSRDFKLPFSRWLCRSLRFMVLWLV